MEAKQIIMEIVLTPLSQQTLDLLKEGYSAKEIAHKQNRTRDAVETHMERLRRQFQARNTTHLIVLYIEAKAA